MMEYRDEALSIRRYDPRDRDAVRNLHVSALREVGAYLGSGGRLECVFMEKEIGGGQ